MKKNDYVLYWNEHKNASDCPNCCTYRWKKNAKAIHSKILWYFPSIPRFRRMVLSPEIVHDFSWHAQDPINNGKLSHPRDGINPHMTLSFEHSC